MRNTAIVFGFATAVGLFSAACASNNNNTNSSTQPTPAQEQQSSVPGTLPERRETAPVSITAPALMDEFKKDIEAARAKYDGSTLQVTGVVSRVKEEDGFVALKTNFRDFEIWCVPDDPSSTAQAKVGKQITIKGRFNTAMGAPDMFINVKLQPCEIP
jgi:hypothetical protein